MTIYKWTGVGVDGLEEASQNRNVAIRARIQGTRLGHEEEVWRTGCLQLATICDADLGTGFATAGTIAFHLLDDVEAVHNLAKDHMLTVQPKEGEKGL